MKFNPFRPNNIVGPGMFRGRGNELHVIEKILFQTKHGNPQHFLIEGERGIGKSSLLLFVDMLGKGGITASDGTHFNFVVVSVELTGGSDYFDIIRNLARELKSAIAERQAVKQLATKAWEFLSNWEVMGVKFNKDTVVPEPPELLDAFTNTLIDLVSDAEAEIDGVLILIDEADKPSEQANLGELVKLLTERLSKKQCDKVVLGLAGLPNLIFKLSASHESAPRVFEIMSLLPLEPNERMDVIRMGLEEAHEKNGIETKITDEALELISHLSEGYPHFVQQFGYSAFDHDKDDTIDSADVLVGAYSEKDGALTQLGKKYFNEMYFASTSSNDYRKVLDSMAAHSDGWVQRASIISETDVSEHTVTNALRALKERNVILQHEAQRGLYRLPTKSFAAWINARRSVEERAEQEEEPNLGL